VVPLVRDEILRRHGVVVTATLGQVTRALTTDELVSLNHRVAQGEAVTAVVEDWLDRLG